MIGGIPVIVTEMVGSKTWKQVRFPRSKRKRIRKKWAKDRRNFDSVELPYAKMAGGTLFCNRLGLEVIKRKIAKEGAA